ncbi:MAG: primosomal protein N' [Clostridia bacterium]|nr:primosomal protein N' [Clostridia bacterium]
MTQTAVAKVAVEQTAFHFDKLYSYRVTPDLSEIAPGCRVLVPFGKGNRFRQGIVMELEVASEQADSLKPVMAVLDEQPLLNEEMMALTQWMKERTFCTVFDAVRAMLPTGLYWNVRPVYQPVQPLSETEKQNMSSDEAALYALACVMSTRSPNGIAGDKLLGCAGLSNAEKLPELMVKKGWFTRGEDATRRTGDATRRMARLAVPLGELETAMRDARVSPKQRSVLALLEEVGTASVKELCYLAGVTGAVLSALEKKQLVDCYEQEILRSPFATMSPRPVAVDLNAEQQTAFDELKARYEEPKAACALLYGVTGSGKTQVYIKLIDTVIADGKQALVLVPEISLTPQTMELFLRRYGNRVAVLHSGLSVGERMDEWKRIRRGEADIVVGTRSAVFAPLSKLGVIIMDEEQEHTYKSENTPRYHARDVAKFRCNHHHALLLLTSATPGVESYQAALGGRYSLHTLTNRYGDSLLPQVQVVDMREESGLSLFSEALKGELAACFEQGKQAILLLNRRGYHTFLSCRSCGKIITCPSCSISLTYHRASGKLMCHYCGHTRPPTLRCPECGSDKVRYSGMGTQRVEEELTQLFPNIRILRMDTDSTMSRFAYEEKFREFAEGKYQVMIGTQMVAKGLDFPNVSLVGVLSADQALYAEDYRSFETAFSLLTQVIGRAGRRDTPGKAIIQTTVPEHYVIDLASKQDYPAFYEVEIAARKLMKYPPFADIGMFGFVGVDEKTVKAAAVCFLEQLRRTVAQPDHAGLPLIALDPTPASVARVAGKYRYKLIVKFHNNSRTRALIAQLLTQFSVLPESKGVSVYADINPATIL